MFNFVKNKIMKIKNISEKQYDFFTKKINEENSFVDSKNMNITSIVYSDKERTLTIEFTNPLTEFAVHEIFSMYFIDAEKIIEMKQHINTYEKELEIVQRMMNNYSEYSLLNNNSESEDTGDSFVIMTKSGMIFKDLKRCLEELYVENV